jgi:hypothetical protein
MEVKRSTMRKRDSRRFRDIQSPQGSRAWRISLLQAQASGFDVSTICRPPGHTREIILQIFQMPTVQNGNHTGE